MNTGPVTLSNYARTASVAMYPALWRRLMGAWYMLAGASSVNSVFNAVGIPAKWAAGTPAVSPTMITVSRTQYATQTIAGGAIPSFTVLCEASNLGQVTGTSCVFGSDISNGFACKLGNNPSMSFTYTGVADYAAMNIFSGPGRFAWVVGDGVVKYYARNIASGATLQAIAAIGSPGAMGTKFDLFTAKGGIVDAFAGSVSSLLYLNGAIAPDFVKLYLGDPFAPIRPKRSRALSTGSGAIASLAAA